MLQHRIARFASLGVASLVCASLVGCVSKDDYLAIQADRDNLSEQLTVAERQAEANKALASGYRDQLSRIEQGGNASGAMIANLETQMAGLVAERDKLAESYDRLMSSIGTGPALPEALTSELSTFAANNPDVIEFDADRGIVKFKSDVTFQSGDAALTPEATSAIDQFAQILNGNVARSYELRVAGHTDNVGNFSAVTKQRGHKDNWYLSAHRAISVGDRLMSQGITKSRVGILGFADQRPVADNSTAAGRAQNRRVEVLILPSTVGEHLAQGDGEPTVVPAAATIATPEQDDSDVMK